LKKDKVILFGGARGFGKSQLMRELLKDKPTIPKYHPDLPYSMNVMLRDIRSYLARKLWKERRRRCLKNTPK